jgi:hypothetical protein
MAKNQPAPRVHEHRPGKTIAQAVANANAHVQAVNKASKAK